MGHAVEECSLSMISLLCHIQGILEYLTIFGLLLFRLINNSLRVHNHAILIGYMDGNCLRPNPVPGSISPCPKLIIFIFMLLLGDFLEIFNTEPLFIFPLIFLIYIIGNHSCQLGKPGFCHGLKTFFIRSSGEHLICILPWIYAQDNCFHLGIGLNEHLLFTCIFTLQQF